MSEDDKDQKTEDPSGKRLDEAREKGQLPISRELSSWTLYLGIWIVIAWLGQPMFSSLFSLLHVFVERPDSFILTDTSTQHVLFAMMGHVVVIVGLSFLVLAFMAVVGIMAQTGFFASTELLAPKFERINPVNGWKRIASMHAIFDLGKSILKMIFLGIVAYTVIWPVATSVDLYVDHPMVEMLGFLHEESKHLVIKLLLAFTVIAVADISYQRYEHFQSLKMTKTEVKDEYKQQEGDPAIKGRLRAMRIEKARKRMMAQVPKADVVITNPTHYAVALKYDSTKMGAPRVLAKGINLIAEKIKEIGGEHDVPIVSNPPLARALYDTVEIDHEILPEHYKAVAQVISYIYKLKKKRS